MGIVLPIVYPPPIVCDLDGNPCETTRSWSQPILYGSIFSICYWGLLCLHCSIINVESDMNPDHTKELARINRIIGQLEGIQRMIESGQYCMNIPNQTKAVSAIHSLETTLLEKHPHHCVTNAFSPNAALEERESKIQELFALFHKRLLGQRFVYV